MTVEETMAEMVDTHHLFYILNKLLISLRKEAEIRDKEALLKAIAMLEDVEVFARDRCV